MVDHRNKEVEEQRRSALLHLHLHSTAALESVAGADDECEIVCSQLGIGGWGVGVGEASRGQDGAALDAGLQALLLEGQALQVWKVVAVGGALYRPSVHRKGGRGDRRTYMMVSFSTAPPTLPCVTVFSPTDASRSSRNQLALFLS